MIEIYDVENYMNDPDWKPNNVITIELTFRGGLTKAVHINVSLKSTEERQDIRRQVLVKRKLLQSIFEHNTHGQITVQGLTVRADDLIAIEIK